MINDALQFFKDLYNNFTDFLKAFVNTFLDLLKDFFFWILDTVMSGASALVGNLFNNPDYSLSQYMTALPSDLTNILGLIGFVECFALIVSAIAIRLVLQLIPFTRLGS